MIIKAGKEKQTSGLIDYGRKLALLSISTIILHLRRAGNVGNKFLKAQITIGGNRLQ